MVFIVIDNTGFAHLGCESSIHTPDIDARAAGDLRYKNMRTAALYSPMQS